MYERSDQVLQIKVAEGTYLAQIRDHFNRAIFQPMEKRVCRFWISGSSVQEMIRGKESDINDYDLYFPNDVNLWVVQNELERLGMVIRHENDNHVRYGHNKGGVSFDLVKRFFSTPSDFINHFDFTVCGFAFDKDGYFYAKAGSLVDLAGNKLVMENKEKQAADRIKKYWEVKKFDRWPVADFMKIQNEEESTGSY